MNKQQAIDLVTNSASSIFTKQDVLQLLEKIEHGFTVDYILDKVESALDYMSWSDIVDADSATFDIIDGDRVMVDGIDVNVKDIMRTIRTQINP